MTKVQAPEFCEGIRFLGARPPEYDRYASQAVIRPGETCVDDPADPAAAYQVLLAADALRFLTLQITASKGSGHPGGFASSAEAHAALLMLGHINVFTEIGHHAPGFYSALFLDTSLEEIGITTVTEMMERFRERDGLLGHLSAAIPGVMGPAGPLGQGHHFAMAAAYLHSDLLFPVTIGDGGMNEPYVLSAMYHFHTAFPDVTNFLPVLIWNGHSQEHHSMFSHLSNEQMSAYWRAQGFDEVVLVDAADFEPSPSGAPYVDSTRFPFDQRLAFAAAVLGGTDRAARSAMSGRLTVLVIKHLKGAGMHISGAASHNLHPSDSLDDERILEALQRLALPPEAWTLVRENLTRAGGGPAAASTVTRARAGFAEPIELQLSDLPVGEPAVPATAVGDLVAQTGLADPRFLVTSADGTAASGMSKVVEALGIRHPTEDPQYHQGPTGRCFEPVNEDACAGLAAGLPLLGSRAVWLSYEAFAVNGWPFVQTVTQAMAELDTDTPSVICVFTAAALEQGRNGWTHQRPEIEAYIAAMMRNGNLYPLFPPDAATAQAAYRYATEHHNKGFVLFVSKSPVPTRLTAAQARDAVHTGAAVLLETKPSGDAPTVVFASAGDLILGPVMEAAETLAEAGVGVRVVSVVNPRRFYRPSDVAWEPARRPDGDFSDDTRFEELFGADLLVAVTGGASAVLEPVLTRADSPRRVVAWHRGETTATGTELMEINGMTADALVGTVRTSHGF